MLLGMCTGWGIGAAAMRAALAARDQTVLRETLLRAQQRYVSVKLRSDFLGHLPIFSSAAGAANPDAEFKLEIFQGAFLDTRYGNLKRYCLLFEAYDELFCRSSVIYGVFLGVGSFVFALLRAYSPKLTIMSLFGSIVLDIFCVSAISLISCFLD